MATMLRVAVVGANGGPHFIFRLVDIRSKYDRVRLVDGTTVSRVASGIIRRLRGRVHMSYARIQQFIDPHRWISTGFASDNRHRSSKCPGIALVVRRPDLHYQHGMQCVIEEVSILRRYCACDGSNPA